MEALDILGDHRSDGTAAAELGDGTVAAVRLRVPPPPAVPTATAFPCLCRLPNSCGTRLNFSTTGEGGRSMAASREVNCGQIHLSIANAIVHAEKNLGSFRRPAEKYMGTLKNNSHFVVGFQLSPRKRWRLDFDQDPNKNK
jgi:hypothetical protein